MAEVPTPGSISFEDIVDKKVPHDWGYGSTPRTAKLRDALYYKASVVKEWGAIFMGMFDPSAVVGKAGFRSNVKLDMDRARIMTKSYRETEGVPEVIRKAKAIAMLCEEMPVTIKPGELIVGDPNGTPNEIRWHPEISIWWMPDAVTRGGFKDITTDEERKEILEDIVPYWENKCLEARIEKELPPGVAEGMASLMGGCALGQESAGPKGGVYSESATVPAYDFDSLYADGIQARVEKAERNVRDLEANVLKMPPGEFVEKKRNWEAMAICGRGIIRFAERYAELAREQSKAEQNEVRRKELEEVAATLDWVPANPPRTFQEALQFYWIVEVVGRYLAIHGYGCGIRIDQIWWPYYEADIKADRITRAEALELVECLFMKIQETGIPACYPPFFAGLSGGDVYYTANIGGTKPNGVEDGCTDVTCLCLEALAHLRINQPPLAMRYHRNINPDVVARAIDLTRTGTGHPSWFNEDLLEKWGLLRGFPPEVARDTAPMGCVANYVKGKFVTQTGLIEVGGFVGLKLLEEVLTQGGDIMFGVSGEQAAANESGAATLVRPQTKDSREMTSSDELLDAWTEWLFYHAQRQLISYNVGKELSSQYHPDPTNSLLLDESLDEGLEAQKLNAIRWGWPNFVMMGRQNVGDSLAAIQKLVFDEKKYTMDEMIEALKVNWMGREEMRQDFLNAPKYGNDDDFADEWQRKVIVTFEKTTNKLKDAWGFTGTVDSSVTIGYQMAGLPCAASPDGRKAGEHLADGSTSPMAGVDKKGPTAVINSAAKIPFLHTHLFNQRFQPMWLEGENKSLFSAYLRQWYDTGNIEHIQFNVVDSALLREAQVNPEEYPDLQVRVAGFSAFFVDLPMETQESIIARTEQSFS